MISLRQNVGKFRHSTRKAFSLIEVVVVMTILAVLISFSTPTFSRTMEQSHADLVGAGLRTIAVAQRFYWLENRNYAPNLQTLIDEDLIDGNLTANSPRYEYSISASNATSFQVQARRRYFDGLGAPVYDGGWSGALSIDETGVITGAIEGPGDPAYQVTPAF